MFLGLAAEFISELRKRRGSEGYFGSLQMSIYLKPVGAVLLTSGYVYAFGRLGFEVSTLAYVTALLWLFGFAATNKSLAKRFARIGGTALAITVFVYGFFVLGFGVQLPTRWVLF